MNFQRMKEGMVSTALSFHFERKKMILNIKGNLPPKKKGLSPSLFTYPFISSQPLASVAVAGIYQIKPSGLWGYPLITTTSASHLVCQNGLGRTSLNLSIIWMVIIFRVSESCDKYARWDCYMQSKFKTKAPPWVKTSLLSPLPSKGLPCLGWGIGRNKERWEALEVSLGCIHT